MGRRILMKRLSKARLIVQISALFHYESILWINVDGITHKNYDILCILSLVRHLFEVIP